MDATPDSRGDPLSEASQDRKSATLCADCEHPITHGMIGGQGVWLHVLRDSDGIHYRKRVGKHLARPRGEA